MYRKIKGYVTKKEGGKQVMGKILSPNQNCSTTQRELIEPQTYALNKITPHQLASSSLPIIFCLCLSLSLSDGLSVCIHAC